MDAGLIKLSQSFNSYFLKLARSLPIPANNFLSLLGKAPKKAIGRVLPPTRAGQRLASGAPPLPSHMDRARTLMKDKSYASAAKGATGGELRDPTAMLAMGLRGSGGQASEAMGAMRRVSKLPKITVEGAKAQATSNVEAAMAARSAKMRAAHAKMQQGASVPL